jgi:hypothetical protein
LTTLIGSASAGDTIHIAQATHAWTSNVPVVITKALTISGGGTYAVSDWTDTGTWPTQLNVSTTEESFYIASQTDGNQRVRITGIYFNGTTDEYYGCYTGNSGCIINERNDEYSPGDGNLNPYRIDNCKFNSEKGVIAVHSNEQGLIDHIYHSSVGGVGQNHVFIVQRCGSTGEGDDSFTDEVDFGGSNFVFIEDSTINITTAVQNAPRISVDSQAGGRFVFRHNQVKNCQGGVHGTETGAPLRGAYTQEIYNNTFTWSDSENKCHTSYYWRGGPLYYYGNTVTAYDSAIRTWVRRTEEEFGRFLQCDGDESWDGDGPPDGWRCLDQQGTGKASHSDITDVAFSQEAEMCYIWNNTVDGDFWTHNTPTYLKSGSDYTYCTDSSCAPGGYSAYQYPHPFQDDNPPISGVTFIGVEIK